MSTPLRVELPSNTRVAADTVVTANPLNLKAVFQRYRSSQAVGLIIGSRCIIEDVGFNVGPNGLIEIGNDCHMQDAFLMSEVGIRLGHRVVVGWHAVVADSDFHPLSFDARVVDAEALSPDGRRQQKRRPDFVSKPVTIEDDVWVGPNAMVLKGVTIGRGTIIEPGAVVTRDVPAGSRVIGNPAQTVDE